MESHINYFSISTDKLTQTKIFGRKTKNAPHKLAKEHGNILDSFNDTIAIIDKEGLFVFVNKATERRTGISAETLINRHFLELVDPEYHEFAKSSFRKVMNGEKIPPVEMERQTASGEKVIVEANWTTINEDGTAVGVLGVLRDVTVRKRTQEELNRARDELEMRVKGRTAELQKVNEQLKKQITDRIKAEEKLKESEEKYRSLFENSGDAVFIVDIESGIILDANHQAKRLTGRPGQEIIGMHQSRLHSAQHAEYYKKKFQKHIKNELVFDLEAEVVKKDGTVVPVFICSSLINVQGKKVIQEIFRDISKEKMISDLKGELATKKLVNKAKVLIANHYNINDSEAMRILQRESRKQRRKLKEVAQAVISSKFILD